MALTSELYGTPSSRLDSFVAQWLQPSRDWKEEVLEAVRTVEKFLREEPFQKEHGLDQDVRVLKVIKVRLVPSIPGPGPGKPHRKVLIPDDARDICLVIPSLCCSHLRTPHLSCLHPTMLLP